MEKDEYTVFNVRKDIALAILGRIDHFSMNDMQLLPEVVNYIVTGNEDDFTEFREFHSMKDVEKRTERLKHLTKSYEDATENNKKAKDEYSKYIQEYKEYVKACFKFLNDYFNKEEACRTGKADLTLRDILDFLDEHFDRNNGRTAGRKLYIQHDGRMTSVESIDVIGGKIVMNTSSSWSDVLPQPPQYLGFCRTIYEIEEKKKAET